MATSSIVNGEYEFIIDKPTGNLQNNVTRVNSTGTDDATEKSNGDMDLNNSTLEIKNDKLYTGFRFQGVNVDAESVIESAYISLRASDNKSGNLSVEISVQVS
ncbi:MAG: hypothetical protein R2753_00925 [Chitinophagales bacterium]